MKVMFFTMISVLMLGLSSFAQTENRPCPTLSVSGGGRVVEPNEPMNFTANLGGDLKDLKPEYNWTVSNGKIIDGQGTPTITVILADQDSTTATVEIKGLPPGCVNTFSETRSRSDCGFSRSILVDEFGKILSGEAKMRIQQLYLKLENEPAARGYIINYGTDREIAMREKLILKSIAFFKYDGTRVTIVRGGANPYGAGVWTKFWIVPPGADPPRP